MSNGFMIMMVSGDGAVLGWVGYGWVKVSYFSFVITGVSPYIQGSAPAAWSTIRDSLAGTVSGALGPPPGGSLHIPRVYG